MAFVCELCGCSELIKSGEYFVCVKCNTKYSLEEARKLMSGDPSRYSNEPGPLINSLDINSALELARKSFNNNDYENSAKYYDVAIAKHPSNWEAKFYSIYAKAMTCPATETVNTSANLINNSVEVLKLIANNLHDDNQKRMALSEVVSRLVNISTMLITNATNYYNSINRQVRGLHRQSFLNNIVETIKICYIIGDQIQLIFGDNFVKAFAIPCWKTSSYQHQAYLKHIKLILGADVFNNYKRKIQIWSM